MGHLKSTEIGDIKRIGQAFEERLLLALMGFMNGVGTCLLYTSDAADERSSVDLGGRRIIKKKTKEDIDE